jgi:hypothetical protein
MAIPAGKNVVQTEAGKVKIQEFSYREKTNVESGMNDYTSYNWNSNEEPKEKSGSSTSKNSIYSLQKAAILGTSDIMREKYQEESL